MHYCNQHVVEVGGGSGHLARILARLARSILVFEPSVGLRAEMLPEANITLVNEPFAASLVDEPSDLIVCRQVLEHVADPLNLLRELHAALVADGYLYLEVPRAEYIEEHAALFDLHYAHVQYFHEPNLLRLAARGGFRAERQWRLKGGHDIGVLLRPQRNALSNLAVPAVAVSSDLSRSLECRQSQGRAFLATLAGNVALYGATWHGVAFLTTFQLDKDFTMAIDDNADFSGCRIYSKRQCIPVRVPTAKAFEGVDTVLITAYLHEEVIAAKLQGMGFNGGILRVEPDIYRIDPR